MIMSLYTASAALAGVAQQTPSIPRDGDLCLPWWAVGVIATAVGGIIAAQWQRSNALVDRMADRVDRLDAIIAAKLTEGTDAHRAS